MNTQLLRQEYLKDIETLRDGETISDRAAELREEGGTWAGWVPEFGVGLISFCLHVAGSSLLPPCWAGSRSASADVQPHCALAVGMLVLFASTLLRTSPK